MDVQWDQDASTRRATLCRILRSLRTRAGLRTQDIAEAMGMGYRTYQRFEAGEQGVDLETIRRFAQIVEADPWGIILGVEFGSVDFALNTAANKAASWLLVALRRFDRRAGKDIASLDPRTLSFIFSRGFDQISVKAQEVEAELEQWMLDGDLGGET
ncbi:MAG: helix-turn-helix domain-containing protein [Pseudomonadota bacterium]